MDLFTRGLRPVAATAPLPSDGDGTGLFADLDWSPDGRRVALVYNRHLVVVDRAGQLALLSASALPATAATLSIQPYGWLDNDRFALSANWHVDDDAFGRTFFAARPEDGSVTWEEINEAETLQNVLAFEDVTRTIEAWPHVLVERHGTGRSADGSAVVARAEDRTGTSPSQLPRVTVWVGKLGGPTPTVFDFGETYLLFGAFNFDVVVVP